MAAHPSATTAVERMAASPKGMCAAHRLVITATLDGIGCGNECCEGGGGSCFSATSTVTLESGKVITYPELKVGDRVLSVAADGTPFFDKVFRITHYSTDLPMTYVRLTTTTGEVLELSPTHLLHVESCCALSNLDTADKVAVGDTVFVSSPTQTAMPVTIKTVETAVRKGQFNAHTISGNIVVSGIVASHFTTESSWGPDSIEYAPAWYKMVDLVSNVIGAQDASTELQAPRRVSSRHASARRV